MNRYPIYVNYDTTTAPIGFVQLDDAIEIDVIREGAIVPYLGKRSSDEEYSVWGFGFVPRISVDTRQPNERN